jgi:hypothetical protein
MEAGNVEAGKVEAGKTEQDSRERVTDDLRRAMEDLREARKKATGTCARESSRQCHG